MRISPYYIYNNIAITACTILGILSKFACVSLSKIAVMLPLLLDDSMVEKMMEHDYRNFDAFLRQNRMPLSNFNDRYKNLLPQMVDGIALLLDLNIVSLYGNSIQLTDKEFCNTMIRYNESERLKRICCAIEKLMDLTKRVDISTEYSKLKVLL